MMKVLHPTDFSEAAERASAQAIRLARALGAEVVLCHVAVEAPLYGEGMMAMKEVQKVYDAQREWATSTLEQQAAGLRASGLAVRWVLRVGVPADEIVKTATQEAADFIVMGTHGRGGLERFLLGSVADRVIRTASCPVITVRSDTADV